MLGPYTSARAKSHRTRDKQSLARSPHIHSGGDGAAQVGADEEGLVGLGLAVAVKDGLALVVLGPLIERLVQVFHQPLGLAAAQLAVGP